MARPSARENWRLWELVVAFALVTAAGVVQMFHFFNNAWLVQTDSGFEYQRGLGDDCLRSENFSEGIRCSDWKQNVSTFVKNGYKISAEDVTTPSTGLSVTRLLLIVTAFLYLVVIFLLFLACVKKRDILVQKLLCGLTLLLAFLNIIAMLPLFIASKSNFVANHGECSLGRAFYYFLLSNLLLWIGSAAHFDTWKDVRANLECQQQQHVTLPQNPRPQEMHLIEAERRPSFLAL